MINLPIGEPSIEPEFGVKLEKILAVAVCVATGALVWFLYSEHQATLVRNDMFAEHLQAIHDRMIVEDMEHRYYADGS
jgi:hypothetical protein